tara:strand:- start:1667 stop:2110 length:444 start_codon:yes stop_codon:yes gene_type:complete
MMKKIYMKLLKPLTKGFTQVHIWLYEKYNGKYLGEYKGLPFCLIRIKGRKSGLIRTIPLLTIPKNGDYILVASNWGSFNHPLWYLNLVEEPTFEMKIGSKNFQMKAEEIFSEEKEKLWPKIVDAYPDYQRYKDRTDRNIPVLVCKVI